MGLFGPWGSGKSTILEEVGRQLREDQETETAFVMFDAWRFEGDSLRRELIREVGGSLKAQKALTDGFDFEKHTEIFDIDTTVSRRARLGFDPVAIRNGAIAGLLVLLAIAALLFLLPKLGLSRTTTLAVLIACSGAFTTFLLVALQQAILPDPEQATRRRLEFPDQFAANFRTLLDHVSVPRLVIAIDNLDRCSPARVTEILSSVKTFLEPAFGGDAAEEHRALEQMYFIVAADDAALHRHLTAQELSPSGSGDGSASEYLRKFFGSSLRIRELLDEDVREFTAEEMAGFINSRGLKDDELKTELIQMTSQGLKRNPRRIKQFVNNLQLRLQMLAERKQQNRVQIDADVRVVAKLAIIEEEFPAEFEQLQDEPTLLREWHAQARISTGSDPRLEAPLLDPALASFLRFTDDIQPPDVRAYLNLKQTKAELELPGYGEFIDLLDDGDVDKLRTLVEKEEGEQTKYANAARWHFDAQLRGGAWSRAHNTLRSVVEVPQLHGPQGAVFVTVLGDAMRQPSLSERLSQLEPNALLGAALQHELAPQKLRELIGLLISGMGAEQTSEVRHGIAEALAKRADEIDAAMRDRIRETLSADTVRPDFDSYLPLAEAMPEVLGDEVYDEALGRIEELGAGSISRANSAYRVTLAILGERDGEAELERFLQLVKLALDSHREAGAGEFGAIAGDVARLVEGAEDTPAMHELTAGLIGNWEAIPAASLPQALELGFSLCRNSPRTDAGLGAALAERLFELEDGDAIVNWLAKHFELLPAEFGAKTKHLAVEAMAGASTSLSRSQIDELWALYDKGERASMRRDVIARAIAGGRTDLAGELTASMDESERRALVAETLSLVEGNLSAHLGEAAFVVGQRSLLKKSELFDFAILLADTVFDDRGTVLLVAPLIGKLEIPDPAQRLKLVEHLLKTERDMVDATNREAVLRAAWSVAGKQSSKARSAIAARLKEIRDMDDPDLGPIADELL